ncbi:hypothetical protein BDA96_10G019500 [Sorghum bicolor]|uniref:Uncharacterized protein n=2 Tax=Sorghum bicolor TaxID=4558 RepID=A0A921TXU0_SORBI|nr:hypothetical protein BDA96_10G019400 [Sorghum bicolor]KAG0512502.1 hypothetical protein BDA96_10G019500 [Sorghum bicolor]KXG19174.1 hypothetical protein SORBI_3010G016800 [Sorghum bicolor]
MATSKKMAVVTMVFMAAVLLLATVESAAAAAATATATATATTSDSSQQLGLGATRKLLQIVGDTCGGNDCSDDFPLGCCAGSPVCRGICSTLL